MLLPILKDFKGLVTITGPTKSGKSQLAEFLIKNQESIIYLATSKPRENDPEWQGRINIHRRRRPDSWKLIEYPQDICKTIKCVAPNKSILLDSLGGVVEQHLIDSDVQWESFQSDFIKCLLTRELVIIIVVEEIGWGIVPATPTGHLFRERLCYLSSCLSRHSVKKWLAVNGTAIDLSKVGYEIP